MSVHVEIDLSSHLASELEQIGREHLSELLERGLKAFRIDRALDQYADGAMGRPRQPPEACLNPVSRQGEEGRGCKKSDRSQAKRARL